MLSHPYVSSFSQIRFDYRPVDDLAFESEPKMTRGNQRDEARLNNAKDAAGKGVKKDGSYLLRKEADSNALAEKVLINHC